MSIKNSNLRLLDVQHLLTWIYADSIAPNWIFVKVWPIYGLKVPLRSKCLCFWLSIVLCTPWFRCTAGGPTNMVYLQNKPLLCQTVVVAVPGLDWETKQALLSHLPRTSKALGAPTSCRIDDGKATFASCLDRLLYVQNKKSSKRPKAPAAPPQPPESYAISLATMHQLEYPMPVRIHHTDTPDKTRCDGQCSHLQFLQILGQDDQLHPPPGFTWTGRASFSSAGRLPEELRMQSQSATLAAHDSGSQSPGHPNGRPLTTSAAAQTPAGSVAQGSGAPKRGTWQHLVCMI